MRSIAVPKPSRTAYRYYNTLIFHGYFRAFITVCLLATGGWMLLASQPDPATFQTIRGLHVAFGLFGAYLIAFHVIGYFACSAMKLERVQEARKNMADTGWILLALAVASLVTGLGMFFGEDWSPETFRLLFLVHLFAAGVYPIMAVVHFYYYWRHWKPALGAKPDTAGKARSAAEATGAK
jgi:phage shock protein PspC (stress-responsive transcriptional regulator)